MRKLATIQTVKDLLPIEGADNIELATLVGVSWQCVVKKGDFRPRDRAVFFEVDSVPPEEDVFAFLWTSKELLDADEILPRPDNFRIKTMKLRGTLSQGLLMPLILFPGLRVALADGPALFLPQHIRPVGDNIADGQDVTEALGITQWEPKEFAFADGLYENISLRRGFPTEYVPKTDETRVQSAPAVLDELRGKPYIITEMLDGTSATYVLLPKSGATKDGEGRYADSDLEFHACSRNNSLTPPTGDKPDIYWQIALKYELEKRMREQYAEGGTLVAIQGEICGPGIQGNPLRLNSPEFFLFNLYSAEHRCYLTTEGMEWVPRQYGCKAVPILDYGVSFAYSLDELLGLAQGKYAGTNNDREGIVVRPFFESKSVALGGRLSFKVISNRYLLKEARS